MKTWKDGVLFVLVFGFLFSLYVAQKEHDRCESTRRWVENLQACMYVTSVQAPCVKCGNAVYNTSQFWSDGPAVHRTRCAKCGQPDPESMRVTHEWWASNSWKWEKK